VEAALGKDFEAEIRCAYRSSGDTCPISISLPNPRARPAPGGAHGEAPLREGTSITKKYEDE
jgi:hypothetical protein